MIPDELWFSDIDVYGTFRRAERTLENLGAASITLDEKELEEIKHVLELNPVSGTRYDERNMQIVWG